jgi:hypothetical protein
MKARFEGYGQNGEAVFVRDEDQRKVKISAHDRQRMIDDYVDNQSSADFDSREEMEAAAVEYFENPRDWLEED